MIRSQQQQKDTLGLNDCGCGELLHQPTGTLMASCCAVAALETYLIEMTASLARLSCIPSLHNVPLH